MSKGSDPRPLSVSPEEFARRWERTFGEESDKEDAQPWTCLCGKTRWMMPGEDASCEDCGLSAVWV